MSSQAAIEAVHDVNERSRLLIDEDTCSVSTIKEDIPNTKDKSKIQFRTQLVAVLFVCVLYFNVYVSLAPETSIREEIICKAYYDRLEDDALAVGSPERDCSVNAVQRELTLLNQAYLTAAQLPGFLLALPYGILADRIGRRKVLFLSVIGIVLCDVFKLFFTWQSEYFPIRAIWFAPLLRLIGGGDAVAATMVLAVSVDVYEVQDRATVFARIASAATICELVAPLVGSALMLRNPWIPVLMGSALFLTGVSITLILLPETLTQPAAVKHDVLDASSASKRKTQNLVDQIFQNLNVFCQHLVTLFAIPNAAFLLFGFFAVSIGTLASGFELQYVHKRLGWSYSYAGSILAIRPAITLFVLLIIIPIATKILITRLRVSNMRKDLLLVRVSAALLTAGTLLLSVSETTALAILSFIIFSLGNAFVTIGKSLLTSLGPPEMTATLLSAMNVSASLGAVIAGPLIAVTFDFGLRLGGFWVGAPLMLVTLLYALTLGSVCIMDIRDDCEDNGEIEG